MSEVEPQPAVGSTDLSVITYPIDAAELTLKIEKSKSLKIGGVDDKEGYRMVKAARLSLKDDRVRVNKRREELKRGALDYGKEVDRQANLYKIPISEAEAILKAEEDRYKSLVEAKEKEEKEAQERKLQERIDGFRKVDINLPIAILEEMTEDEYEARLLLESEKYIEKEALREQEERKKEAERALQEAENKRIEEEERKRREADEEKSRIAKEEFERKEAELEADRKEMRAKQKAIDDELKAIEETKMRIVREDQKNRDLEAKNAATASSAPLSATVVPFEDTATAFEIAGYLEHLAEQLEGRVDGSDLMRKTKKRLVGCAAMIRRDAELLE